MQYKYVLQSLTLWAAILEDMFRLWYLAEQDLLSESQPYELKNTGMRVACCQCWLLDYCLLVL